MMKIPWKKLWIILWIAIIAISCNPFPKAESPIEFKVKCPKGTEPHGICFAEYHGEEIIICILWYRGREKIHSFQGYDIKGKQLRIPQEELRKRAENILESIRFRRRYVLETRRAPWTLALLDRCIYPDKGYCDLIDTCKLTLENAVWKVPLTHYTNYKKALDGDSRLTSFDYSSCVANPALHQKKITPVFTSAEVSFQPYQVHIWGISGSDGKEVAYYCSSIYEDGFLPNGAFLDSTLRHIVVIGSIGGDNTHNGLRFYASPTKFAEAQPCFRYDSQEKLHSEGIYANFFLSSDIFCSSWSSGNMRSFTELRRAALYSFSENRMIADVQLNHRGSNPCNTWPPPWCDVSKNGKWLAVGFERTFFLKIIYSRDDFQTWVRIYRLAP